jgi:hypothetical protein
MCFTTFLVKFSYCYISIFISLQDLYSLSLQDLLKTVNGYFKWVSFKQMFPVI